MSVYRAQAHLDAPLEDVWALVGNPATYPEWWPAAVEIQGDRSRLVTCTPRLWESLGGGRSPAG